MTGTKTALEYIAMFIFAGFLLWFLNPIINIFELYSETGNLYTYTNLLWDGIIFIILLFSSFWFLRKLKEWEVVR